MAELPDAITSDPRYSAISERRERSASKARAAQSSFRWYTRVFVAATALAAIAGGLILYGIEAKPDQENSQILLLWVSGAEVRVFLLLVQGAGLGAAAFCGYMLSTRDYNKRWTDNRLDAEDRRLERQKAVLELAHAQGTDTFKTAGAGFKAFIKEQMDYLSERETQHDRSAYLLALAGAIIAGIAALAGALSSLDSRTVIALIALTGVISPALVAALQSWSDANANAYRANLHQRTWNRLNEVLADQATFDTAISKNDLKEALAYAERVFEVLREDHAGFAQSRRSQQNN